MSTETCDVSAQLIQSSGIACGSIQNSFSPRPIFLKIYGYRRQLFFHRPTEALFCLHNARNLASYGSGKQHFLYRPTFFFYKQYCITKNHISHEQYCITKIFVSHKRCHNAKKRACFKSRLHVHTSKML